MNLEARKLSLVQEFLRIDNENIIGALEKFLHKSKSDFFEQNLKKINEAANDKTVKLELNYKYDDPIDPQRVYYRSDHYNFAKKGIPAIFYFNGVHNDYHQPGDTPDKIEYDALAKRAQLAFATAWELANRKERPIVDKDGK